MDANFNGVRFLLHATNQLHLLNELEWMNIQTIQQLETHLDEVILDQEVRILLFGAILALKACAVFQDKETELSRMIIRRQIMSQMTPKSINKQKFSTHTTLPAFLRLFQGFNFDYRKTKIIVRLSSKEAIENIFQCTKTFRTGEKGIVQQLAAWIITKTNNIHVEFLWTVQKPI